ncbi:MAG: hypothetical protein V5A37_03760 [Halobacteriales archaeon]
MSQLTQAPESGNDDAPEAADLSKSEIFDLLRNQRRRFVIHYLKAEEGSVELGHLATRVAAWEYGVAPEAVTSSQRKRVYTTLQQSHLPKLDDADIVEFDSSRGVIRPREVLGDITIYLEIVPGHEFAWHEYYLGLGAVSLALMAAVGAGIYPFTFAPPIVWGTVISVAFLASAAVQVYTQRGMDVGTGDRPQEIEY